MTDYLATLRRHARITILRFAAEAPQYTTNVSMLSELMPQMGINFTRDQIITEARWLADQGFVEVGELGGLVTVQVTQRGLEIANGITTHPEIKRPAPRV